MSWRLTGVLLLAIATLFLASPWLPLDATGVHLERLLMPPAANAWLGTDELGRDLLARLLLGGRTSLLVAVGVVTIAALVGIALGIVAGMVGGWFDYALMRLIDLLLAFPGLLLAITLAGMLGPGVSNVVIALVLVGWVGFARLARAQVLVLRESEHLLAARVLGSRPLFIARYHLLPLIAAPLLVEATFGLAGAVLAEAGLSFLGLGVQPPAATWGSMIRDGARYMLVAPHYVLVPGLALSAMVLVVNLLGDRLRDHLDVRREPPGGQGRSPGGSA